MITSIDFCSRTTKFKKIFEIVPKSHISRTIYWSEPHNLNLPSKDLLF